MALIWNFTQGLPPETDYPPRNSDGTGMNPVTETIIWGTMATNIGDLTTHEGRAEFYARIRFYEQMYGPFMKQGGEPRPITAQDVEAHAGLTTNVAYKSRTTWAGDLAKRLLVDNARLYYTSRNAEVPRGVIGKPKARR